MKVSQILGIVFAAALIIFSIAYPVPEKDVNVSSSSKAYYYSWSENIGAQYINGDCYNYQIEASLKAGYLAGVLAMKSLTFVGGLLLLFLTLYSRVKCQTIEEQTRVITEMAKDSEQFRKSLEKLFDNSYEPSDEPSDEHSAVLNSVLSASETNDTPNENEADEKSEPEEENI